MCLQCNGWNLAANGTHHNSKATDNTMADQNGDEQNRQTSSATVESCAQADSNKPDPEFDPGDLVDAFGYYETIKSRHWSKMWEEWMYRFEGNCGRTPETEVSDPDPETTRYPF